MSTQDITSIEERLLELAAAERTRWQAVSRLLLQVEAESLWEEHASSFTSWIDGVAARASMQPSGLWRSLKAGRIYMELADTSDAELLDDLDVTAESLELVDKISRHAPAKVSKDVVRRTLSGELRVQELRRTWRTYRPAAGGITARGRLPNDPDERLEALQTRTKRWKAEKRKPAVKEALAESEILTALQHFEWLGQYDMATLAIDLVVGDGRMDAVAVVRRSTEAGSALELHGVQIQSSASELTKSMNTATVNSGCDYLWLAVPVGIEPAAMSLPARIGVLSRRQRGLTVARPAKRQRVAAEVREAWLATLLGRAYHWPNLQ